MAFPSAPVESAFHESVTRLNTRMEVDPELEAVVV
jgi:hypothetical protein